MKADSMRRKLCGSFVLRSLGSRIDILRQVARKISIDQPTLKSSRSADRQAIADFLHHYQEVLDFLIIVFNDVLTGGEYEGKFAVASDTTLVKIISYANNLNQYLSEDMADADRDRLEQVVLGMNEKIARVARSLVRTGKRDLVEEAIAMVESILEHLEDAQYKEALNARKGYGLSLTALQMALPGFGDQISDASKGDPRSDSAMSNKRDDDESRKYLLIFSLMTREPKVLKHRKIIREEIMAFEGFNVDISSVSIGELKVDRKDLESTFLKVRRKEDGALEIQASPTTTIRRLKEELIRQFVDPPKERKQQRNLPEIFLLMIW